MAIRLMTIAIRREEDVVGARQRARQISALLGFEGQDQARIATAVSEIARNAFRYARGGEVEFALEGERAPQVLWIQVRDTGPGIAKLDAILEGRYRSSTGMGMGLVGARRLMDQCVIDSDASGTRVVLKKLLPDAAELVGPREIARITSQLAAFAPTPLEESQQQNRDLMRALEELRQRQDELVSLNHELEDTNRGVVALYAELEERAESLRRADETKTRFLSNMSHEFRTPLNSIRALTGILLDRADGPLTSEQEVQLQFIRKGAEDLGQLVDDLLDLAKIEAGKVDVRTSEFTVSELFSALRGMLRPLLVTESVALRFDAGDALPMLHTDEGKVSQILRNFISNALKFTERGEIRVSAALVADGQMQFSVADTGIGIPPEDHERIFEEFAQVRSPLQARVKGTGLGLPLCRRLAGLLGGAIALRSAPGEGSTFSVTVPLHYRKVVEPLPMPDPQLLADPARIPVLIVEDEPETQRYYEAILRGTSYVAIPALTLRQGKELLAQHRPGAVVLDIVLGGEMTWRWLGELKGSKATSNIPVIIATSADDPRKSFALGADAYLAKPIGRVALLEALNQVTRARILVIDDDPATRYAIRKLCDAGPYQVLEAGDAGEGLRVASAMRPEMIILDLNLPDRRGEEVLLELASLGATSAIPVVIATSETLSGEQRATLGKKARAVLSKDELDRPTFERLLETLRQGAPES